jgi:hypothetical protein
MPRHIAYFTEYTYCKEDGSVASPYLENGKWYIETIERTVREVGELCKLSDSELTMLVLTYGSKDMK